MARTPNGNLGPGSECSDLDADDLVFVAGLEAAVDRALLRVRPGDRLVYGIHQELEPRLAECLQRRYRDAGWSDVRILPGATGAATLILAP